MVHTLITVVVLNFHMYSGTGPLWNFTESYSHRDNASCRTSDSKHAKYREQLIWTFHSISAMMLTMITTVRSDKLGYMGLLTSWQGGCFTGILQAYIRQCNERYKSAEVLESPLRLESPCGNSVLGPGLDNEAHVTGLGLVMKAKCLALYKSENCPCLHPYTNVIIPPSSSSSSSSDQQQQQHYYVSQAKPTAEQWHLRETCNIHSRHLASVQWNTIHHCTSQRCSSAKQKSNLYTADLIATQLIQATSQAIISS